MNLITKLNELDIALIGRGLLWIFGISARSILRLEIVDISQAQVNVMESVEFTEIHLAVSEKDGLVFVGLDRRVLTLEL